MSLGSSKPWTEILFMLTGSHEVSANALLLYYKPLLIWLKEYTAKFHVPIGWK